MSLSLSGAGVDTEEHGSTATPAGEKTRVIIVGSSSSSGDTTTSWTKPGKTKRKQDPTNATKFTTIDDTNSNTDSTDATNTTTIVLPRVPLYNDIHLSSKTMLPRTWRLHDSEHDVAIEQVDANSCFQVPSFVNYKYAKCLPSLYVIGFEKAGTTILNMWLSQHPGLKTRWTEGRFFDANTPKQTLHRLGVTWRDYLQTLPSIPISELGRTWTMEKSPAYAHNPYAPLALSALVPSARLLLVTRDPTQRAYSEFVMYTHHYPDFLSAIFNRPKSYFVKNIVTNDVRYIGDNFRDLHPRGQKTNRLEPGRGGSFVPFDLAPPSSNSGSSEASTGVQEWRYLSYPPDPIDFDRFIRDGISKHKKENKNIIGSRDTNDSTTVASTTHHPPFLEKMIGRGERILTAGLYGPYIEQWLKYFPPHNLIVIPSEDFFVAPNNTNDDLRAAARNMAHLQQVLELLPRVDYNKLLTRDPHTGRVELSGFFGFSLETFLNGKFNSNGGNSNGNSNGKNNKSSSSPMLPQTKKLLDEFYCDSNRQLKRLTNKNRYVPTKLDSRYACYNS